MRPILFIDRDGTIVSETMMDLWTKLKINFLPDALYYLKNTEIISFC